MAQTKAETYTAAKASIFEFDALLEDARTHGFHLTQSYQPGFTIEITASQRKGDRHDVQKPMVAWALKRFVIEHAIEAMEEYRIVLVARARQAHIDAANEARAIIAENPPK